MERKDLESDLGSGASHQVVEAVEAVKIFVGQGWEG